LHCLASFPSYIIIDIKDEFAAAEAKDTGKPLTLAKNMDISRAIANFRYDQIRFSCK